MKENIITIAKKALAIESEALVELNKYNDATFEKAVTAILNSKGRLVISGIGKSAIIAQKMVATFNSTGTPALFLHAAEAIHGDSGMIQANDIVLIVSKSGESPEITRWNGWCCSGTTTRGSCTSATQKKHFG